MINDGFNNGWLVVWTLPLWKMMEFVGWGYCSQYMEKYIQPDGFVWKSKVET
jgi:hypothetical protein